MTYPDLTYPDLTSVDLTIPDLTCPDLSRANKPNFSFLGYYIEHWFYTWCTVNSKKKIRVNSQSLDGSPTRKGWFFSDQTLWGSFTTYIQFACNIMVLKPVANGFNENQQLKINNGEKPSSDSGLLTNKLFINCNLMVYFWRLYQLGEDVVRSQLYQILNITYTESDIKYQVSSVRY